MIHLKMPGTYLSEMNAGSVPKKRHALLMPRLICRRIGKVPHDFHECPLARLRRFTTRPQVTGEQRVHLIDAFSCLAHQPRSLKRLHQTVNPLTAPRSEE